MNLLRNVVTWFNENRYGAMTAGFFSLVFAITIYDMENPSWQNLASCAGYKLAHGNKNAATAFTDKAIDKIKTLPISEQLNSDEVLNHVIRVAKK